MSPSLHSMTGFARTESPSPIGTLSWELRTVNHRYLDVQFRLPEPLRRLEPELRKRIAAELARGKLDCTVTVQRAGGDSATLNVDESLLRAVVEATRAVAVVDPDAAAPGRLDLLRWPGVLAEPPVDEAALKAAVVTGITAALAELMRMRADEGGRLAGVLEQRCDELERLCGVVRARRPEVLAHCRTKLDERLARLDVDIDPGRLEAELALHAQKLDVDEELDRLAGHLEAIRAILAAGGTAGRKLDFLIQELNREANTLASKAADATTTAAAVDMKVAIEQMREQVQNIE